MSQPGTVGLERTTLRTARITFANPPANLVIPEPVVALHGIVRKLANDPDIQVVVFSSDLPDFFINHYDGAAAADIPMPEHEDDNPVWTDMVLRVSKAPFVSARRGRGSGSDGAASFRCGERRQPVQGIVDDGPLDGQAGCLVLRQLHVHPDLRALRGLRELPAELRIGHQTGDRDPAVRALGSQPLVHWEVGIPLGPHRVGAVLAAAHPLDAGPTHVPAPRARRPAAARGSTRVAARHSSGTDATGHRRRDEDCDRLSAQVTELAGLALLVAGMT
jgi:hypothetical protein